MGKDVKTMAQAWNLWDRIWADSRIAFLPEPDGLETEFRSRSRLSSRSPRFGPMLISWLSPPLLVLRLITFDRALKPHGGFVHVL